MGGARLAAWSLESLQWLVHGQGRVGCAVLLASLGQASAPDTVAKGRARATTNLLLAITWEIGEVQGIHVGCAPASSAVPRLLIRDGHVSALLCFREGSVCGHFVGAHAWRVYGESLWIESLGLSNTSHLRFLVANLGGVLHVRERYGLLIVDYHLLVGLVEALLIANGGPRTFILQVQDRVFDQVVPGARIL